MSTYSIACTGIVHIAGNWHDALAIYKETIQDSRNTSFVGCLCTVWVKE